MSVRARADAATPEERAKAQLERHGSGFHVFPGSSGECSECVLARDVLRLTAERGAATKALDVARHILRHWMNVSQSLEARGPHAIAMDAALDELQKMTGAALARGQGES